jgi:hypothetical protein
MHIKTGIAVQIFRKVARQLTGCCGYHAQVEGQGQLRSSLKAILIIIF